PMQSSCNDLYGRTIVSSLLAQLLPPTGMGSPCLGLWLTEVPVLPTSFRSYVAQDPRTSWSIAVAHPLANHWRRRRSGWLSEEPEESLIRRSKCGEST